MSIRKVKVRGTTYKVGSDVEDVKVNGQSVVNEHVADIEVPSLEGYAKEQYVDNKVEQEVTDRNLAIASYHDNTKADKSTTYTKTEVDSAISNHHDSTKADKSTTYNKTEVDTKVSQEAQARQSADTTLQTNITNEATARQNADNALGGRIDTEETARQNADNSLQGQIDALVSKSDVVDVVGTYQELLDYDTSALGDNDVVKVLTDNTHDNARSYYRWSTVTETWTYVGSEAIGYTKAEADTLLNAKVDKVTGKGLSTNDYSTPEKNKLAVLENYDDTALKGRVQTIEGKEADWDAKQNAISDLETIRSGAELGSTALQAVPNTYRKSAEQDVIDNALSERVSTKMPLAYGLNAENYLSMMKEWFLENGLAPLQDFSKLCDGWYRITRKGWTGGTKFTKADASALSTGTTVGDNVGMVCEPSTLTTKGRDDYADIPLFYVVDCNVVLDEYGKPHITAIDGVCGNFEKYNPDKIVCAMQMTPFIKYSEDEESFTFEYTDEWNKTGFSPWQDAINLDGTVRTWVVHTKYLFGDNYSSCSGQPVHTWDVSHNSQLTGIRTKWGNKYCGKTTADDGWIKWMCHIKHKALSPEAVGMYGCTSYYNNTVHPALAEENVKRVLLTNAQLNTFVVGSTVCVGTASYGSKSTLCSVVDRATIESIETVSIGGTNYTALNLDVANTFTTTTDLFVTSWMWTSGSLDDVPGFDGARVLNNSKYPFKIQGIECVVGCYEVLGDAILRYDEISGSFYCRPYVCRDASKLSTSITADYKGTSYHAPVSPESSGWQYIQKLGHDADLPEVMFPELAGSPASSSNLYRDALYNEHVTSVGLREWLAVGYLNYGGYAGVSCVGAAYGLSSTNWHIGGRLSVTGNRGELQSVA